MALYKSILFLTSFTAVVAAGTLNIPIKGTRTNVPRFERHAELLVRRMEDIPLENLLMYYEIILEIGTPSQNVSFTIDTGSSDLWVMDSSNPYCATSANQLRSGYINCTERQAIFKSEDSSSFNSNDNEHFNISYYDRTFAEGNFVTDNIQFGDETLQNANFALATETNSSIAVFGVGPVAGESVVTGFTDDGKPEGSYPNVPALLKSQGLIDTAAYSLWLNDLNAAEGQLLFGGVDHSKYVGTLQLVPMVAGYIITASEETRYPGITETLRSRDKALPFIMLHNIYLYNDDGKAALLAQMGVPALLDSGTSLSFVPQSVLSALVQATGAEYNANVEGYVTYCDLEGGLALDFSGATITVPYNQFLIPLIATDGSPITVRSGRAVCMLPVVSKTGVLILGDVIMRSMYCVFDNDNFQVAIANTRFNVTESNVESISGSIPSASSAPSYSSTSTASTISWYYVNSRNYTRDIDLVTNSNVGTGSSPARSIIVETSAPLASQRSLSRSTTSRSTTSRSSQTLSTRSTTSRSTTSRSTTSRSTTSRSTTSTSRTTGGIALGLDDDTSSSASGSVSTAAATSSAAVTTIITRAGNTGSVLGVGSLLALPFAILMLL